CPSRLGRPRRRSRPPPHPTPFRCHGKLERLYFPEADEYAGVLVADTNEPDPEPVSASEPQPEAAPTTARAPSAGEQLRREEIRQRLEQLRQRLQNNN